MNVLPGEFAICRLDPELEIPDWALQGEFCSITRSPDELSIVCLKQQVPQDVHRDEDWRCLKLEGPISFSLVGVLLRVLEPLAARGITVFALGSFDTDYILIKTLQQADAIEVLRETGFRVIE